jgi:hypothetical protein
MSIEDKTAVYKAFRIALSKSSNYVELGDAFIAEIEKL